MAAQNVAVVKVATVTWGNNTDTGLLTMAGLAAGGYRQGAVIDLACGTTTGMTNGVIPQFGRLQIKTRYDAAQNTTAGNNVQVRMGWGQLSNGADLPGNMTGSDGNYNGVNAAGDAAASATQVAYAGQLTLNAGIGSQRGGGGLITLDGRYAAPLVINNGCGSMNGTQTEHQIILDLYVEQVQP